MGDAELQYGVVMGGAELQYGVVMGGAELQSMGSAEQQKVAVHGRWCCVELFITTINKQLMNNSAGLHIHILGEGGFMGGMHLLHCG